MATDMAALAEALKGGAAANAQLGGLQNQLQAAQQRADTPYTRINPNTGYGSPLEAIAMALRRDRGAKEVRELQPQIAGLQEQAAAADIAGTMYGHQRAADETTYKRSRNAAQDLRQAEQAQYERGGYGSALEQTLDKERKKRELTAGDADDLKVQNVNTGDIATASVNKRTGRFEIDGEPVKQSEWVRYEAPRASRASTSSGSGNPEMDAEVSMFPSLVESFEDDYGNPAWGIPGAGEVSNWLAREAPIAATPEAEERQKWWSDFETLYNLPTRHEMFGSALTTTEKSAWRNATINPNMTADQIRDKLNTLLSIQRSVVDRNYVNPESGLTRGPDVATVPPNVGGKAPAGIAQRHWDDLSADEQQEYLEMRGEL